MAYFQELFVDEVTDIIRDKAVPLTFDRHVYFINFTAFDKQSPKYINLIRDPAEKLLSRCVYKNKNCFRRTTILYYKFKNAVVLFL